jgi:hypothetical protein
MSAVCRKAEAWFAVAEAGMAAEALARCVATLSAVFIFGGDIMRAEDPGHLGGLGWIPVRFTILGLNLDGRSFNHCNVPAHAEIHQADQTRAI